MCEKLTSESDILLSPEYFPVGHEIDLKLLETDTFTSSVTSSNGSLGSEQISESFVNESVYIINEVIH